MRALRGWLALLLLPLVAAVPVHAAAKPEVQSAWVNVRGGVFEVNARSVFPVDDDLLEALVDGAAIHFDLQAVVEKQRRYWLNATLVDVTLRRELSWDAVSERFVLKELDSGDQQSYAALDEALQFAGVVESWPVVVEPQLDPFATYEIHVRASMHRRRLPGALRAMMFWSDGGTLRSDWSKWILPR